MQCAHSRRARPAPATHPHPPAPRPPPSPPPPLPPHPAPPPRAEALGAIGTSECVAFLDGYKDDSTLMLKESCEVALDAVEYWKNYSAPEGEAVAAQ